MQDSCILSTNVKGHWPIDDRRQRSMTRRRTRLNNSHVDFAVTAAVCGGLIIKMSSVRLRAILSHKETKTVDSDRERGQQILNVMLFALSEKVFARKAIVSAELICCESSHTANGLLWFALSATNLERQKTVIDARRSYIAKPKAGLDSTC
jgi:hypothetical protein